MRFLITHSTQYRYASPVLLGAQVIRLRPRDDGSMLLQHFELAIEPVPAGRSEWLDVEGNVVTGAWFSEPARQLLIRSQLEVETVRRNPFDYLPDTPGDRLYAPNLAHRLAPWLSPVEDATAVRELGMSLAADSGGSVSAFLDILNRYLFSQFTRELRATGAPLSPLQTLQRGTGACRDLAVLFMEICRQRGIAARFVSGYQKGDTSRERRHLHAWPEVYLPGGGWRGYDPTHGLAVADEHVPLAAAATPEDAAPVTGSYSGTATASMEVTVGITVRE